jgi:hypothetical protein
MIYPISASFKLTARPIPLEAPVTNAYFIFLNVIY